MDGPFEVFISLDAENNCGMEFLERRINAKDTIKELTLPLEALIDELLAACKTLFEVIKKPDSLKSLSNGEDVDPLSLTDRINKSPQMLEDFNELKDSYDELCKYSSSMNKE